MTNREIAQEISNRIGTAPVPFNSVYSIAFQIYHELGGEESQFDSVYSILLEILPIVEGGIKPIEEVSELPEASENKNKLFRLNNGEKDVYAAKLLSSKTITTNKLPDEQQIDKAYISEAGVSTYYYKGSYTITCSDGVLNWYLWDSGEIKCATLDNAVNSRSMTPCIWIDSNSEYWSNVTETGATTTMTMQEVEKYDVIVANGEVIPAIYNAPESAQIGNATFNDGGQGYIAKYSGEEVLYNNLTWYKWITNDAVYYITNKKASEIYGDFKTYWMSDAKIVYFNGSGYEAIELYSDITDINISQLNAPDSEQVNNAYIYDIYGQHKYFYKGLESIVCTDGTINVPHWIMEGTDGTQENNSLFTTPTANSLYKTTYENAFGLLNCQPNYSGQDYNIFYDTNNNKWKSTANSESTTQMITNSGTAQSLFDSGVNISTVKYQRTETTEEWGWEKIATEDVVNNLSDELASKANKVDYVVQLNPTTQQYDWTSLNSVTETGVYRISIEVNMTGTVMKIGTGDLFVSNTAPRITQIILMPSNDSIALHVRKSTNSGSSWTDSNIAIPSVNDGATTSTTETYSVTKINSLISALDARIAVLEGK